MIRHRLHFRIHTIMIQLDMRVDSRLNNQFVKRLGNIIDRPYDKPLLLILHIGKAGNQNDWYTLCNDFLKAASDHFRRSTDFLRVMAERNLWQFLLGKARKRCSGI